MIDRAISFFENHPFHLEEAKTVTLDETITKLTHQFLTQIQLAYATNDNLPWIHESHRMIHSLKRLELDAVKETIAKIKSAQTLYKERHAELNADTPAFLKGDEDFILKAYKANYQSLRWADLTLRNSPNFMQKVYKIDYAGLEFASNGLKDHDLFMLSAVSNNVHAMKYASNRLRDNDYFMIRANNKVKGAIEYSSKRLKNENAFMFLAMKHHVAALSYASDRLKNDEAFMIAAMELNIGALEYVSNGLKDSETFMLAACIYHMPALDYASNRLKDNDRFMLAILKNNKWAIRYVSDRLKDDESFMTQAITLYGLSLEYASEKLKDNETFVMAAVSSNGKLLQHASNRLKDNETIVTAAVNNDPYALAYGSERVKHNELIVLPTLLRAPVAGMYVSSRLFNHPSYQVMRLSNDNIDNTLLALLPSYGFCADNPVVKAILNYRNPDLKRYCMAVFFILMSSYHNSKETWDEVMSPLFEKKQWAILPLMLMAFIDLPKERTILPLPPSLDLSLLPALFRSSLNLAKKEDHFVLPPAIDAFFKKHKEAFKDARSGALNTLITLLKTLKSESLGTIYLKNCLVIDNLSESLSRMKLLTILFKKRSKAHIKSIHDFSKKALLKDLLAEFIREALINEDSLEAFERTFLSSRHPEAIFTYGSLFLRDEVMNPTVKRFIELVVAGDFKAGRNEANSHKYRLTLNQKKIWEAGAHSEAHYEQAAQAFNPKEFLNAKLIVNDHAPDKFPYLKSLLIREGIEGAATEEEALCLKLTEAATFNEQLTLLKELKKRLVDGGQFLRDIEDQIITLEGKTKDVTLYDSAHWQDLFYAGTEVLGSCQNVNRSASINKCLLGYVLDGKVRIICLKHRGDEFGPIIARAIIKILITKEGDPALFLETVYPGNDPIMATLIKEFAKQRAHALGIGLYEEGSGTILSSEGCAAPWEFEDARDAEDGITKGTYTIRARKIV